MPRALSRHLCNMWFLSAVLLVLLQIDRQQYLGRFFGDTFEDRAYSTSYEVEAVVQCEPITLAAGAYIATMLFRHCLKYETLVWAVWAIVLWVSHHHARCEPMGPFSAAFGKANPFAFVIVALAVRLVNFVAMNYAWPSTLRAFGIVSEQMILDLNKRVDILSENSEDFKRTNSNLRETNSNLAQSIDDMSVVLDCQKALTLKFSDESSRFETEHNYLQADYDTLLNTNVSLQTKNAKLVVENVALHAQITKLMRDNDDLKADHTRRIFDLEAEIRQLNSQVEFYSN